MSSKAARIADLSDEEEVDLLTSLLDDSIIVSNEQALVVGSPVEGPIVLTTHVCKHCSSEMQTIGVGHPTFECSACAANRGRRVEMHRYYELLEES